MSVLMLAHNVSERGSAIRALSIARWLAAAGVTSPSSAGGARRPGVHRRVDGRRSPARASRPASVPLSKRRAEPDRPRRASVPRAAGALRRRAHVRAAPLGDHSRAPGAATQERAGWRTGPTSGGRTAWRRSGRRRSVSRSERSTAVLQSYTRRRADAVTVISSDLERRAGLLGIPPERIRRIAVGANDDLFRPQPAGEARARFGLPEDALVLVHTGFAPFDDWLLAHTFAELAVAEPRAYLLMSGRRFPLVEERAAAVGAGHRVVHVGVVPYGELGSVMACGDVMVVPYTAQPHNEARFPNRAGDYLAAGRPIATNPTGDLGAPRHDGANRRRRSADARGVRPRDPRALSRARGARRDGRQGARTCRDDALVARRRRSRGRSVRRVGLGQVMKAVTGPRS